MLDKKKFTVKEINNLAKEGRISLKHVTDAELVELAEKRPTIDIDLIIQKDEELGYKLSELRRLKRCIKRITKHYK